MTPDHRASSRAGLTDTGLSLARTGHGGLRRLGSTDGLRTLTTLRMTTGYGVLMILQRETGPVAMP